MTITTKPLKIPNKITMAPELTQKLAERNKKEPVEITDKPLLHNVKASYSQKEDTCGRANEEWQEIEIEAISVPGFDEPEEDIYFVLKTERWAVNGPEELEVLFEKLRENFRDASKNKK